MTVAISRQDVLRLADIVREETGNHVQEKNFSMLESRIRSHILKLGIDSIEQYWDHFKLNEKEERESLQSLMTTHYTFFFREFAHFEILENWISEEIEKIKVRYEATKEPLRIWSAACSRGQEVYSLAMFLEANLLKAHGIPYEILGTDIDPASIAHGENGVYPISEVNTIPQMYLSSNWKRGTGKVKEFAAIHPALKAKTKFEVLNFQELPSWKNQNQFDVIFCRNVFIYFSDENVKRISLELSKKLRDEGLFISGMSEPLRFPEWNLQAVGPSSYKKTKITQKIENKIQPAKAAAHASVALGADLQQVKIKQISNKYRVLCVDDSTTIQSLIKKIFSTDPACEMVDIANNGQEARDKLNAGTYDIITLDIHMPIVNGIEFLERLYNKKTDPPVLMISSVNRTDIELATKSISLGAFDYIEKPAMNNLQKSTDEILTKTKMALRTKNHVEQQSTSHFDASIGQKIVVPDASQCFRIITASDKSKKKLEHVIRGQKGEYRSPACLIIWNDAESNGIESELLTWTENQIINVREANPILRPNYIYLLKSDASADVISKLKGKSASIQLLDAKVSSFSTVKQVSQIQVLVDEDLKDSAKILEHQCGIKISDITPATSFPSLSVEFFASLRKAAA